MDLMYLEYQDRLVPVTVGNVAKEVSLHTGREVLKVLGTVTFKHRENDEWFRLLLSEDEVESSSRDGSPKRKWRVSQRQKTITNGSEFKYDLELSEVEHFEIKELEIDGISLQPNRYSEDVEGGYLDILARVRVPNAVATELRERMDGRYFPVVRRGIDDRPRQMRFGMCAYSEHGDSEKLNLVLVDEARDSGGDRKLHVTDAVRDNRRVSAAYNIELTFGILSALVERGIFSEEEAESLRDIAYERIPKRMLDWRRVDDADDLDD